MVGLTQVIPVLDVNHATGIAEVSTQVRSFISDRMALGYTKIRVQPVRVSIQYHGGAPTGKNWYTVQVNYTKG